VIAAAITCPVRSLLHHLSVELVQTVRRVPIANRDKDCEVLALQHAVNAHDPWRGRAIGKTVLFVEPFVKGS
jgi:hypothetical protein